MTPLTNGHLNVLDHAANIFDKVYICIMTNPQKKRFVDVLESEKMICQIIKDRYDNPVLKILYRHTKT